MQMQQDNIKKLFPDITTLDWPGIGHGTNTVMAVVIVMVMGLVLGFAVLLCEKYVKLTLRWIYESV